MLCFPVSLKMGLNHLTKTLNKLHVLSLQQDFLQYLRKAGQICHNYLHNKIFIELKNAKLFNTFYYHNVILSFVAILAKQWWTTNRVCIKCNIRLCHMVSISSSTTGLIVLNERSTLLYSISQQPETKFWKKGKNNLNLQTYNQKCLKHTNLNSKV